MIISILLISTCIIVFFSLKKTFDEWGSTAKNLFIGALALIIAGVITMELFVYVHQRIIEFLVAIENIPGFIVAIVFLGLFFVGLKILLYLSKKTLEDVQKQIRKFISGLKEGSKIGWYGLKGIFGGRFQKNDKNRSKTKK